MFVVNGVDPAAVITNGGCLSLGTASPGQPNVPGIHIQSDEGDDCRIAFVTTNKANTRIGYFGLSNRFGVDVHNGFQIRDAGSSYATRILIGSNGNMGVGTDNTNSRVTISSGSSANAISIRNTTGGNGNVGILFSTQDHSGGREKAAIYHQDTHGGAHYGGDFIFCLNSATGSAAQVGTSDERMRITRHGELKTKNRGDQRFGLTIADEYGVWGSNTGLAPNTTRTWTITNSSYGWGRFCIGGGDGNYQRAACIIDYGGVMWSTAKSYYHNEIVKSSSGASISTTYNNGSIVVSVTAGSNWWYYTVNLIQGRRDSSSWATITQS